MRNYPAYNGWDFFADLFSGGIHSLTQTAKEIVSKTMELVDKVWSDTVALVNNAISSIKKQEITNNTYNQTFNTYQDITNVVDAKNLVTTPDIQGCTNASALDKPYPLIIGHSFQTPMFIGQPYTTLADDYGEKMTYHVLYLVGYNDIHVKDICLGIKNLASNKENVTSGKINIDGFYDKDRYGIEVEIQNQKEVDLYNQKVVQQSINEELTFPEGLEKGLELYEFSSPYPQRVDVTIALDGLVGKNSKGEEAGGVVQVKCEYSIDGGNSWLPFGKFGNVEGISYDESTGITTLSLYRYHNMKFNASRSFTWSEVGNAVNNVIELRVQRVSQHKEDGYIYDTISLYSITTYCYDPDKSNSRDGLIAQCPICEKDRLRTTRIGFKISGDELLYNLNQFNVNAIALGRTCTEKDGIYTWSTEKTETANPASMALMILQSPMLGDYIYSDDEIDLQAYGELYKYCEEFRIDDPLKTYGIEANGVLSKQQKLIDLLNDVLGVGRGFHVYKRNKMSVFIDKPIDNTVLILNNQNVLEAKNTKNFDELPSGLKINFTNEDNYAQADTMYIDYADAPERTDSQYSVQELTAKYQTNVFQIRKYGIYKLATLKLRPEVWDRKVTDEGHLAYIGNKIEIQDDTITVGIGDGAEIIDFVYDNDTLPTAITHIVTDGNFDVTDKTKTYGVKIQLTDNYGISIIKKRVFIKENGIYNTFELAEPISLDGRFPSIGDILSFGLFDRITTEAICFGKRENDDGTFNLTLVPYVEEIYTTDTTYIPEFHSQVTVPSTFRSPIVKKPITQEDLQGLKAEVETGKDAIPLIPENVTATALEDTINLSLIYNSTNILYSASVFEWEITKHTGEIAYLETTNKKTSYYFDRSKGEYYEKEDLQKWSFRVRSVNIYGKRSEWSSPISIGYFGDNYTWIPAKPRVNNPIVTKDGFEITWEHGVNFGTPSYKVLVYKDDTQIFKSEKLLSEKYVYTFDRERDGYPEKSDLEEYRIVVVHYNEAYSFDSGTSSDRTSLNADYYGTWKIGNLDVRSCVGVDVIDRTVTLKLSIPSTGSLKYYGTTQFKVSIKRLGIDKVTDGVSEEYPEVTPDENWYKPDLYSSPLNNELAYRTNEIDGFELSNGRYSQTLPLVGQDNNNISNTIYSYKVSAFNETGIETNSIEFTAVALCTSIRDIVKSNEDYKNLYVTKLSALNANVGLISQGGFGNFEKFKNFWALTKMLPEDTGLSEIIKEGAFRVGDEKEYIAVIPPDSSFGEGANKITNTSTENFMIQIKAGNITLTTTGTSFDGGTYIYNESHNKRMKMSDDGLTIEQYIEETDSWDFRARLGSDTDGNLTITNSDDKDSSLPKKGVYVPENRVYHLEGNFYDSEGNICTEFDFTTSNFEDSTLLKEYNKLYVGDIIKNEIAQEDVCLLNNSNLIKVGNDFVDLEQGIVDNSVDYWNEQIEGNHFVWGNE